jgi:hypothetical protein
VSSEVSTTAAGVKLMMKPDKHRSVIAVSNEMKSEMAEMRGGS